MKLITARIRNYRAIDDLEVSFLDRFGSPRPITVFAGPNGSGKTSLLFAITNALRGALGYRTGDVPKPTRDDIRWTRGSVAGWTSERPEVRVGLDLLFEPDERAAIGEVFALLKRDPPPALPDGRLRISWAFPPPLREDGTAHPWWGASVDPPLPGVRSWLEARRLAIGAWRKRVAGMRLDLLLAIGGLCFFPQDRYLIERVVGGEPFSRADPESDDGEELDLEERPPTRTVTEILHYLSDYARGQAGSLPDDRNWEKRIQETFNKICSPKRYLGYLYREDDPLGAPILEDGASRYPLSHAASGEQVILEYITRLSYPQPMGRSLVLIDEPEVHLHPAWTRLLYLAFLRMPGSNQYVFCTHSQELRQRAAADNALMDLGQLRPAAP